MSLCLKELRFCKHVSLSTTEIFFYPPPTLIFNSGVLVVKLRHKNEYNIHLKDRKDLTFKDPYNYVV